MSRRPVWPITVKRPLRNVQEYALHWNGQEETAMTLFYLLLAYLVGLGSPVASGLGKVTANDDGTPRPPHVTAQDDGTPRPPRPQ